MSGKVAIELIFYVHCINLYISDLSHRYNKQATSNAKQVKYSVFYLADLFSSFVFKISFGIQILNNSKIGLPYSLFVCAKNITEVTYLKKQNNKLIQKYLFDSTHNISSKTMP